MDSSEIKHIHDSILTTLKEANELLLFAFHFA